MKHGPLALVDEHMPILVVRPLCLVYRFWAVTTAATPTCPPTDSRVMSRSSRCAEEPRQQAGSEDLVLAALQIATNDGMSSKMQSVIAQLHARGAQLMVMCNGGDSPNAQLRRLKCRIIEVFSLKPLHMSSFDIA
jgi:glucosamine 6-phosphate synthetase-like amidotransferase/phosphosugar isomerase protein